MPNLSHVLSQYVSSSQSLKEQTDRHVELIISHAQLAFSAALQVFCIVRLGFLTLQQRSWSCLVQMMTCLLVWVTWSRREHCCSQLLSCLPTAWLLHAAAFRDSQTCE
jgi:hypothetical protein